MAVNVLILSPGTDLVLLEAEHFVLTLRRRQFEGVAALLQHRVALLNVAAIKNTTPSS